MAYFRDFGKCLTCGKLAHCEVFNRVNASHGKFCARCAGILVDRLNREEEKAAPAARPPCRDETNIVRTDSACGRCYADQGEACRDKNRGIKS